MADPLDEAVDALRQARDKRFWGELRIQFRDGRPGMLKIIETRPLNDHGRTGHGRRQDFPDPD